MQDFEIPFGVRCCVVDAKGNNVFVGNTVVSSDAEKHVVKALEIIDAKHAWIVAENDLHLIPHLCELLG